MGKNKRYILSIDQGTSSTKAIVFDGSSNLICKSTVALDAFYLRDGFVEQDPEGIFDNVLQAVEDCLDKFAGLGFDKADLACVGISNQRETFVIWDQSGKALHHAVSWQCKRSIEICDRLKKNKTLPDKIKGKTGLIIDPYFSGTKLIWLNENIEKVKKAIEGGDAYFGTVDTWLLYRLTEGRSYYTDYTNASRTLFFNLHSLKWDKELLEAFGLEKLHLPDPKPSSFSFGETNFKGLLDFPLPITSMIGDSHAAAFGEGCFSPGTAKATLGTGCSILMNIGSAFKASEHGMVTTICWSTRERVDFALEGIVVSCGATLEWIKNELGLFSESHETEKIAQSVSDNGGVYLVPAFSGLGAPHWQMGRKAAISGLTFSSTKNHIVRAALESIPYQIKDIIQSMERDAGVGLNEIMVDGGVSSNKFVLDFLSTILDKPVKTLVILDISALGAALLAGLEFGIFKDLESLKGLTQAKEVINPQYFQDQMNSWYQGWKEVIKNQKQF
ncbi:FGGY family carbohydrate kinase [Pararhodonellum marinum]|uniref:FGGY family carbohydrate kinase n=1 Tax=Pararhodonellum marinum TaxID=2755358 RepID=UPI00188EE30E|nr:glycerol kinase GlpK [Pararhodonellum marinum]